MAEETSTSGAEGSKKSFSKGLAGAVAKKALVPVAATAATYLTRKAAELWQERVVPAVQERGGGRAVLKETLERAAGKTGGRASAMLSELAERLGEGSPESLESREAEATEDTQTGDAREAERRERRERRQQRQRALEQSGKS